MSCTFRNLILVLLLAAAPGLGGRAFAAVSPVGSITITGGEQFSGGVWDTGTVTATINGVSVSIAYDQYSSPEGIASGLAATISQNCNMPVYAHAVGSVIDFYAKGVNTINSVTISIASSNPSLFPNGSFQTVNRAKVTLALAVSPGGTPNFGADMTFTATVTPSTVTGNVTFSDGTTTLGAAPISNGQAAYTTSALDTGVHSITASFGGSSNFMSATSAAVSAHVGPSAVKVNICCAGSSVYGGLANFTVTVTPIKVNPNHPVPAGTVFFQDNDISNTICEVVLSGGSATCQTTKLTGGTTPHNVLANYFPGTSPYQDFQTTPSSVSWTVTPAGTSVRLTSQVPDISNVSDDTSKTSHTDQLVVFTGTPLGIAGGATPTGTIVFNDVFNGTTTPMGSGTVGANGQATITAFFHGSAAAGMHSITAVYNQDSADHNYQSSTSNAVSQTVNLIPTITDMTPPTGPAGLGFTITGMSFGNNTGTITINGAPATILQWTDTKITLQVPSTAVGAYPPVIATQDNKASDPKYTANFTVRARIVPCQQ